MDNNRFDDMRKILSFNKIIVVAVVLLVSLSLIRCSSKREIFYTVQRGDTLSAIAGWYGVEVKDLQLQNGIRDPRNLQVGTTLKIVVNQGKRTPTPNAIYLNSSDRRGNRIIRNVKLGSAKRYIGNLIPPLANKGRITSRFGYRASGIHKGIDFSAKVGTPIYAAHAGKVVISGVPFSGYGKMVAIAGDGLLTLYAHNNRNFVRAGQYVQQGYKIAEVGSTGKATGPHLHFEVRIPTETGYNIVVDPEIFYR